MNLEIIGAGFGRTGTLSLKLALEKIGFGPCYHMMEVRRNEGHCSLWHRAANDETIDWQALFQDYRSAVDWPVAEFWEELMGVYPKAKVILSYRDGVSWYRSLSNTIMKNLLGPIPDEPDQKNHRLMTRRLLLERVFDGKIEDEAAAIEIFERNLATVRATVPAGQLLDYPVGAGWGPLCEFLGVAVPDEDYPSVNSTEEFASRWKAVREASEQN